VQRIRPHRHSPGVAKTLLKRLIVFLLVDSQCTCGLAAYLLVDALLLLLLVLVLVLWCLALLAAQVPVL
jgi:hypothetical protein